MSQAADISILVRWNERVVIMHSYADVIEMKRANVRNYALIIRSLRASPAFKCECETSSTLSSYIFFSPRRIKSGVNLDYVPNNTRANNIKTKLVSNNTKMKPNARMNNRTHETLFVIFLLCSVNLLNCE